MFDLGLIDDPNLIRGVPMGEGSGWFRNYNPVTGELLFWGDSYNLPQVMAEVGRITPVALRKSLEREMPEAMRQQILDQGLDPDA